MIVHLKFDPKESSYQFLYEIALFDTNPKNLAEIYDVVSTCELRSSDCSYMDCDSYDLDCSAYGVKEALAMNSNTNCETMLKLAQDEIELLRAIIAVRTNYNAVIEQLLYDDHIYVIKNLLENRNLKSKHLRKIVDRLVGNDFDFDVSFNKETHITKKSLAKLIKASKVASKTQIERVKNWENSINK